MVETLFFIGGTFLGFLICSISFKSGSQSTHQAYDIIYTTPTQPGGQESEENEPKLNQEELYDWDEYNSSIRFQEFEEDEDNLEDKPN